MTSRRPNFIVHKPSWNEEELEDAFAIHYFAGALNRFEPLFKADMPFFDLTRSYCPEVRI